MAITQCQVPALKNVLASLAAVGLLGACAQKSPDVASAPAPDTVIVVDTVAVQTDPGPNPELERRVANMQLQLLERSAQVADLRQRLDDAIQEVVRTMAKLQTTASRAEAASAMAEAEIAVDGIRTDDAAARPALAQAEQLLEMSTTEFNRQNYGGSLYLASQARALARGGAGVNEETAQARRPGETPFALALSLRTATRSNVRAGPGLNFAILFTADPGTPLTGYSHTDAWIRIRDAEGREGWVFHSLVENRSP